MDPYEPRYLAGVVLFNEQDFFGAHEVWEDLWADSYGDERRFYQGLIQAAVGLCHFTNGNLNGAIKLYRSSRDYMQACGTSLLGLDIAEFWREMEVCYRPLLGATFKRSVRPDENSLPTIRLEPTPESWPNPDDYLPVDEE